MGLQEEGWQVNLLSLVTDPGDLGQEFWVHL